MSQAPPNGTLRRQLDEMYKAQEPLRRQHEALIRARKLFLQPLTCLRYLYRVSPAEAQVPLPSYGFGHVCMDPDDAATGCTVYLTTAFGIVLACARCGAVRRHVSREELDTALGAGWTLK